MEIWKFSIDLYATERDGSIVISMPEGSKVLCVQMQFEVPCIWAKVDPNLEKVARKFFIVGTGNIFPSGADRYIGTIQMRSGDFVWHVFEGE